MNNNWWYHNYSILWGKIFIGGGMNRIKPVNLLLSLRFGKAVKIFWFLSEIPVVFKVLFNFVYGTKRIQYASFWNLERI